VPIRLRSRFRNPQVRTYQTPFQISEPTGTYRTPFQISEPTDIRLRSRFRNQQVSDSVPDFGTHRYQTQFQISEPTNIRLLSRFRNPQVSDCVPDFGIHRYLSDCVPDFRILRYLSDCVPEFEIHRYSTPFHIISEPTGIRLRSRFLNHKYQTSFQISEPTGTYQTPFQISEPKGRCWFLDTHVHKTLTDILRWSTGDGQILWRFPTDFNRLLLKHIFLCIIILQINKHNIDLHGAVFYRYVESTNLVLVCASPVKYPSIF
jgi:hypothetical protein